MSDHKRNVQAQLMKIALQSPSFDRKSSSCTCGDYCKCKEACKKRKHHHKCPCPPCVPCPPGPVGPPGPQGPQGNSVIGPLGTQGVAGPQGNSIIGPSGPVGMQGPSGLQGPIGPQGNSTIGPIGLQGPVGPQGLGGPQGPLGPQGNSIIGPTGPQGVPGPQGPQGNSITGPAGPQGLAGPQGPQGNSGPAGPFGPQGPVGPQGIQGPRGTCHYQYNANLNVQLDTNAALYATVGNGSSYSTLISSMSGMTPGNMISFRAASNIVLSNLTWAFTTANGVAITGSNPVITATVYTAPAIPDAPSGSTTTPTFTATALTAQVAAATASVGQTTFANSDFIDTVTVPVGGLVALLFSLSGATDGNTVVGTISAGLDSN